MTNEMYFPLEEYHDRWKRVYAEMERRGYDLALVWGKSAGTYERSMDILYLTNFYSSHSGQEPDSRLWNARSFCAAILAAGEEPELHSDEFNPRHERLAVEQHHFHMNPIQGVADALNARHIEDRVAWVGSDVLPVKYAKQLERLTPGIEYVYDDDLVRECRRIKSPRELDLFREGGEIVDAAMTNMVEALCLGQSEAEAAIACVSELFRRGGYYQRIAIAHGKYTNFLETTPMHGFSLEAPEPGDLFHCDILGPAYEGYWMDPARTAVCGRKPTPEQKSLVEDCVRIIEEGIQDKIRHGAKIRDVANAAKQMRDHVGGDFSEFDANWPYFGHSNGCMWEAPYLSAEMAGEDEIYEEGMVIGVEAFLTREGVGTAEAENNLIVTADGYELLTKCPMLWW